MNKIKELLNWYSQYNNIDILITTKSKQFSIFINEASVLHLLGLQYISKRRLHAFQIFNQIKDKTDEEIYDMVNLENPNKLISVKQRVEYFKEFMENLHKATLYQQTHPTTKIKSDHFLVELKNSKYIHLGINHSNEQHDYFETFILDNTDRYISTSNLKENVISIHRINKDIIMPFSFNTNLNYFFQSIQYGLKEELFDILIQKIPFENLEKIEYQGLILYPIYLEDNLENMSLKQISDYLEIDSLNIRLKNKLAGLEINNSRNENEEFYSSINENHKQCDFFFSLDARNIYLPTNSGLMKYNKYINEELLNILINCFEKQLHVNQDIEIS